MKDSIVSAHSSQLQTVLGDAPAIGIIVSENQNLDKMASALSLYLSLKLSGKDVQIISKKDPIVEISNLVGIDKVKKSFDGKAKTLIVSLPYKEGEIEKVSYNIEGSRLNINLFAPQDKGITFSEKDVDYIRTGSTPKVIVTVGVRNANEVQSLLGDAKDIKIIAIDTSNSAQNFAEIMLSDSIYSSHSEIVGEMIETLGMQVDVDVAQNLMDGINSATSNFSSPQTSAVAFEVTAFALKNGARRRGMQRQKSGGQGQQSAFRPQQQQQNKPSQTSQRVPQAQRQSQNVQQPVEVDEQITELPEIVEERSDEKEEVPSDWFVPKVFKSSRNQQEDN